MKSQKGFTLIELLIVIAIIGILSSIAVVSVSNVRRLARDSKRLADMKQLQTALEAYFNDANAYPLETGIDANGITLGTGDNVALCSTQRGFDTVANCTAAGVTMYLAKVPANPVPGGANYVYTATEADPLNNNRPRTFTLSFSMEAAMAGYTTGAHELSQLGIR